MWYRTSPHATMCLVPSSGHPLRQPSWQAIQAWCPSPACQNAHEFPPPTPSRSLGRMSPRGTSEEQPLPRTETHLHKQLDLGLLGGARLTLHRGSERRDHWPLSAAVSWSVLCGAPSGGQAAGAPRLHSHPEEGCGLPFPSFRRGEERWGERRALPAGRVKLGALPAVTQHGSIWTCSRVPFQSIAHAQALLWSLRALGQLPRQPRHCRRHLPAGSRGFCRGSVSPPRFVLLWSALTPSPSFHPCAQTPVPRTRRCFIPLGWIELTFPTPAPACRCTTTGSCQEQGSSSSPCPVPTGSPGWAPPSTPRCQEQGLSREGLREAEQVSLAACHRLFAAGQSAGRAQTWGRKECKTAKEGKQRGRSMSGCSGKAQSPAGRAQPGQCLAGQWAGTSPGLTPGRAPFPEFGLFFQRDDQLAFLLRMGGDDRQIVLAAVPSETASQHPRLNFSLERAPSHTAGPQSWYRALHKKITKNGDPDCLIQPPAARVSSDFLIVNQTLIGKHLPQVGNQDGK